jgi:hypothetical protein
LRLSALSTVKLSFRRKQKKAMSMAPYTSTIIGVDQSMSGHNLMRMRNAGVIGSLRLTEVRYKRFNPMMHWWTMNLSDGGTHAKTDRSYKQPMADNLVWRFLGSTVSDCHWRYKQSTASETGIAKLSPLMYMQNMMKMCPAPAYWPWVPGASAAATDRATAIHIYPLAEPLAPG